MSGLDIKTIYEFDRVGYIHWPGLLDPELTTALREAAETLEPHFLRLRDAEPLAQGSGGQKYVFDRQTAASVYHVSNPGLNLIVDDFISAAPVFSRLVNHAPTMAIIDSLAMPPITLSSTELRYRYKGSITASHMGGPIDARSAYRYIGAPAKNSSGGGIHTRHIDLVTVRVLYALHDIPLDNGPLAVVPGTHKSRMTSPYRKPDPHDEPGMVGLPMQAGDAIIFTENLRHGGFRNLLDTPRRTIHMIYNQAWAGSPSPVHPNGPVRIRRETWDAFDAAQQALFPSAQIVD